MAENTLKKSGPNRAVRLVYGYVFPRLLQIDGQLADLTARLNAIERDTPTEKGEE